MDLNNLQDIFADQYNLGYAEGASAMLAANVSLLHLVVTSVLVIAVYKLYKDRK